MLQRSPWRLRNRGLNEEAAADMHAFRRLHEELEEQRAEQHERREREEELDKKAYELDRVASELRFSLGAVE